MEISRKIEQKRKEVMEEINNDLIAQIKRLNEPDIDEKTKKDIENKI